MVAPTLFAVTKLTDEPPMRLGAPLLNKFSIPGSRRRARVLFTFNSSALLSVVPRKSEPGAVPLLPAILQRLGRLVNPAPSPLKLPANLLAVFVRHTTPLKMFDPVKTWFAFSRPTLVERRASLRIPETISAAE